MNLGTLETEDKSVCLVVLNVGRNENETNYIRITEKQFTTKEIKDDSISYFVW